MDTVSVVIPTWNRSKFLVRAIRSALGQSHQPLEILVCDDGSSDDSEHAVASIGDSRVQWVGGKRGGRPAVPRNRGIARSRGTWIAFLDDDDQWAPEKLSRQFAALSEAETGACCSAALKMTTSGVDGSYQLGWDQGTVRFDDLLIGNRVICSSALVRKDLIEKAGGFPEAPVLASIEDYALWLRIAAFTGFAFSPDPLVLYNDAPSSGIRVRSPSPLTSMRLVFGDFIRWGVRRGVPPRFIAAAVRRYAGCVAHSARRVVVAASRSNA